jgi:hypothetical protein
MNLNRQMPRIDASRFSMVPKQEVPRSTFTTTHSVKSTFNAGTLVPIHVDEVLPGDVHKGNVTIFARLSTLLFPLMDHIELETFFFFVPNRLLWDNWVKMMGERANPADSISYTVPLIRSPGDGFPNNTLYDHFGIPGAGQMVPGAQNSVNALPFRAYNLIYNEWFRDENLQNALLVNKGDGPDTWTDYQFVNRNKKHDYFTSALPWPLKGGVEVTMPLSGNAPITGIGIGSRTLGVGGNFWETGQTAVTAYTNSAYAAAAGFNPAGEILAFKQDANGNPAIYADLTQATGATINALRLAVQTQRFLERDARSGTRYTELLRAHFGVMPEDSRLQRPEYIGGGRSTVQTSAIPQTSGTGASGTTSPLGALGAAATIADQHRFSYHATEHGYIIGIANVRAELTYQQGVHRMWTRQTRYDFYWPVFAHLGEQAIRNDEIYLQGSATDGETFGYQERWAEYRNRPSRIAGMFRSTTTGTIDPWHMAQKFTTLPTLNSTFITENPPLARALAAGSAANGMQILFDSVFTIDSTRPMPMYSVPGMMDRF